MTDTLPIRRATIEEMEAHRNRSLALYAQAYDTLGLAAEEASRAAPGRRIGFSDEARDALTRRWLRDDGKDEAKFLGEMKKGIDRAVWSHLIDVTNLERLMDKKARDDFRQQLHDAPPEATADNCYATLQHLMGDADMIFKRGVAEAFSNLDRRFRSHDGFKIGSRMILDHAFSETGGWNYHRNQQETLRDVERAFCVLDGKPHPERSAGIIGAIDTVARDTRSYLRASAFVAETDLFRVRVFKNGNAHLWFLRDDLLERVNLLLADYYGAALGEGSDVAEPAHHANREIARNFAFFECSDSVAERVLERAHLYPSRPGEALRVLEPSAGTGAIAKKANALGHFVTCVEIQDVHASTLRAHRLYERVIHADFLDRTPSDLGLFDRIVMNPPFDRGRDVDHVTHAARFLAPGGRLAAVMSASTEFRDDSKTVAFRALVSRMGGRFHDLPPRSFAHAGTNVNTVICTMGGRP